MSAGPISSIAPLAHGAWGALARKRAAPQAAAAADRGTAGDKASQMPRVLIVDDDHLIVWDLSDRLQELGMQVCGAAPTAAQAIRLAEETQPDVILMDVRLKGDVDGISAAQTILSRRRVPIIFITAFSDPATVARIDRLSPAGRLTKPVQTNHLKAAISSALGG